MNLILMFCSFISVLSGITFYLITADLFMIFIPGIINFLGLAISSIIYLILKKEQNEESKKYKIYDKAHSI